MYPRAGDELNQVEKSLGPVSVLYDINSSNQEMEINDDYEVKKEKVVEEVVKKEGDEEGDEDADDAPAEEDKKKSDFNPEDFEWTVSNKNPKNLA